MTSPSAAHTGIVRPRPTVNYGTNAAPSHEAMVELAVAAAQVLVDCGDASWCPTCGGTGVTQVGVKPALWGAGNMTPGLVPVPGTCTRCRGARLNPFHGCTFTSDPPCACTTRCQVHQPQETPA